jgi:probable HAF family extracellular repeat protein
MKSRLLTRIPTITLFAALAMPVCMAQGNPSQHKPKHKQYKLIDIDTFGGPAGYTSVNGTGNQILNGREVLTGFADTSTPDPFAPNCYNPDCYVSHAFQWKKGVMTDLGTLADGYSSAAGEINALGWIVGQSQNGDIDPLTGVPEIRAILWKDGQIINVGTLGGNESLASTVNNHGQVVGAAGNAIPDPFSLFGFGTQTRAFLWENGGIRDLGTLGGPDAAALVINERGQIAGMSYTSSTPNPDTGIPTVDPFLWENGTMRDLGTLGGTLVGFPIVANNRGQVAGNSSLAGDVTFHPFLWDRGVLRDLGTLGGDNGQASWVNEAGDVVGEADLPGSQVHDAFLWKGGVMIDLGNLGLTSFAFAINSGGQVVGHSRINDGTFRAFLWENSGPMIDLNTLIPSDSSLLLTDAVNINDQGEISGAGVPAGCQPGDVETCGHAFLLIPDGDCDGVCESRITVGQTNAVPAGYPATVKPIGEIPASPAERLRRMMRGRYQLPGQPAAPRD